jgi:UDP-3-O-[3-hydroxymyristoyl] glucosamine N-acyltransferase
MPAAASHALGELAVRFGCELQGDPAIVVRRVADLQDGDSPASASPDALGFVVGPAWREALRHTRLAAVIVPPPLAADCPVAALVHPDPHVIFARIAALLHPPDALAAGVHPSAVVASDALIDPSARIGPLAVVEGGASIGAGCQIGAQSYVGAGVKLGAGTRLLARVWVGGGAQLGERCLVHPGAVIGSDGFGNAREGVRWIKVPQLGSVRIADDVEIGANTTIDRGALGDTRIDTGVRLDNQIQIGHNVRIGEHTAIAACTGIAGSTRIGARCMIGGGTGIGGQLTIGDDIVIAGFGMVTRSIAGPGMYSSVLPVEEVRLWRRIVARIKRLDVLAARIRKLETRAGIAPGPDHDS